jgi:hypothetical protein
MKAAHRTLMKLTHGCFLIKQNLFLNFISDAS